VDAADDVLAAADEVAPIGAASPATFSGELAQAVVRATPDTAARTRIVRRIIVNFLFLCRSHGAMRTPGIQFWTIDNGSVTAAVAAVPAGPRLGLNLKFSVRSPFRFSHLITAIFRGSLPDPSDLVGLIGLAARLRRESA
jgi:hypothetical protein